MDAMDQMYHENILDHYKHPHNFGELKDASVHHHEHNPLCGDTLDLYLVIKGGKIVEVKYTGKGCAISQASASMLTDEIKGKTLSEIERMSKENILEMLGITLSPIRLKCALLSLDTVKNSIHIYRNYVNKSSSNNGKLSN